MSEQVQSIVEAVRSLDADQRRELMVALAAIEVSRPAVSTSRKQLVDSIRGKYRHVPTSSESFMNRKKEDTALESRP
ncbi:MAG TPA: hypothetical protein VN841_19220 [Bryobacteraceae bacterium]|nr:hypothetical protein [Bryobacteraceae bacterium]